MRTFTEPVLLSPFLRWVEDRISTHAHRMHALPPMDRPTLPIMEAAVHAVLRELGWNNEAGTRRLFRYRFESVTGEAERAVIEDALDHAGVLWNDVYGDDPVEFVDRFCGTCHEVVSVGPDGACPWCEHETTEPPKERKWCRACDKMVWPAPGGRCWRCEGELARMPWVECECGCGELVHRFDRWARRIKFVRGHAPRSREQDTMIDAAPFAEWLAEQVRNVDPIQAIATTLQLTRVEVIDLIDGRADEFSRERIRRALWFKMREGGGQGAGMAAGVPGFFDLYPEAARAKVCPGCGGGKAPHAELCKGCRRKAGRELREAA